MSLIRQSLPALLREADRVLSTRQHSAALPAVLWAGLDEPPAAFAERIRSLRQRRTRIMAAVPHGYPVEGAQAVEFAPKMFTLLHPDRRSRYRCASGGRGSGKSHGLATALLLRMIERKMRVLCAREIMNSLRESVHHLLTDKIDELGLTPFFDVTDRTITCTATDSEVIFAGLFANINSLKSLEAIALCWIEEGESVSARSLEILTPTIRAPGSEVWISMNPDAANAPAQDYASGERADTIHEHVTFADNPWFPEPLEVERLHLQRVDDDAYRHVWLGECRTQSDAIVFRGKFRVEEFEAAEGWDGPYHGLDFGFAVDPTAAVRCWISGRTLYIEREAYGVGVDIDATPALLAQLGEDVHRFTIRADSARPETISYLQRHGFPAVVGVEKWKGSVEDGIAFIRAFEAVVIHPRCEHTIDEFRNYRFKVDRLTGDIRPEPVDAFNHTIDALRYSLAPLIHAPETGLLDYYEQEARALRGQAVSTV